MLNNTVTLYIDDTSLRLLVTSGKRIKKWADSPLEPGLVSSNIIIKEAEVAAQIKQLLKDNKVRAKKVIVGLSGLHCLSRPITLPQLPKNILNEAIVLEAKRELPVPLEQLHLFWQTIPLPEGKTRVFLLAIPRKVIDTLVKVLREAGLTPHLIDIKPLALAGMIRVPNAIIVDVQPTEFDIIIMTDGIPQPTRTVSLPTEALTLDDKLQLIKNELNKTFEFYNANNPENTLAPSVPIYTAGEWMDEPEIWTSQAFSDELGHPILPLATILEYPDELNPSRYMANIGLALKELSPKKRAGFSEVNLNALPATYRPKPPSFARIITIPSAVVLISLLASLTVLFQGALATVAATRNHLDTANQAFATRQAQRQEMLSGVTELEANLAELNTSHDLFVTALSHLTKQRSMVNGNLEAANSRAPVNVELTNISHTDSTLIIEGETLSEDAVLSYATRLNFTERFSEVIIANVTRAECGKIGFQLVLISKE